MLLTSAENIVRQWKEYFVDLNPTHMPSIQEAEYEDSEGDSPIIRAVRTTEVVKKFFSGKAPGVDEIQPKSLKVLDVVRLSRLTPLLNIVWRLGSVLLD